MSDLSVGEHYAIFNARYELLSLERQSPEDRRRKAKMRRLDEQGNPTGSAPEFFAIEVIASTWSDHEGYLRIRAENRRRFAARRDAILAKLGEIGLGQDDVAVLDYGGATGEIRASFEDLERALGLTPDPERSPGTSALDELIGTHA